MYAEIGFADGLADDGGDFGVVEIALSLEFLSLLAAEGEAQEQRLRPRLRCREWRSWEVSDRDEPVRSALPIMRMAPTCASVFSIKYPARRWSTFAPLIWLSFCSRLWRPTTGPVPLVLSAPMLLSETTFLTPAFCSCRCDRVADAILKRAEVVAGGVGWNHDVG